jgi:hypothetical protein
MPGVTQACFGPGACGGLQLCLPDRSGFGPCDCWSSGPAFDAAAPPEAGREGGLQDQVAVPADGEASADGASGRIPPFDGAAPHAPFPTLVYSGGALLSAVEVVTVTFAGDPMVKDLESFGATVASSSWWDAVRAGFCSTSGTTCVGDGPAGTAARIAAAPAASYTDSNRGGPSSLQDWLSSAIGNALVPPPDSPDSAAISNTLYVIYLPKTTKVTLDAFTSCVDNGFDGYHNAMALGSIVVPYAVVMECDPQPRGVPSVPVPTVLANTTVTASHEILESATDPGYSTGFAGSDVVDNYPWADVTGGVEAGDLCLDPFLLNEDQTSEGPFAVQRTWSNANAAAGLDPCVPSPAGEVYFNAAPSRSFFVLDVGQSVTFEVDAFATGPMGFWGLHVQDWSSPSASYLSFSIAGGRATDAGPQTQVENGSKIQVTATLLRDPGPLPYGNAYAGIVSVSYSGGQVSKAHYWPIGFMSPADVADAGLDAAGYSARRAAPPPRGAGIHSRLPRGLP